MFFICCTFTAAEFTVLCLNVILLKRSEGKCVGHGKFLRHGLVCATFVLFVVLLTLTLSE